MLKELRSNGFVITRPIKVRVLKLTSSSPVIDHLLPIWHSLFSVEPLNNLGKCGMEFETQPKLLKHKRVAKHSVPRGQNKEK